LLNYAALLYNGGLCNLRQTSALGTYIIYGDQGNVSPRSCFLIAWCYWPCARTIHTTQIAAIYRARCAHGQFCYTMVNYRATDQW